MLSRARNLASLLGGGEVVVPATKIADIPASKLSDEISTIEQVSNTDALTATGNTVGDQRIVGNNLYIWNGSGWFRIALINESPTWDSGGQPLSDYTLDADSPQDATVITLAASDPDGFPITYSYVTGGSMDSMATISQDSSVFTITPKTVAQIGEGVSLTGSVTFRASDGVNILPYVSSFTINFVTSIENSKYTTLLVNVVDTSDNRNITDSSVNNYTVSNFSGSNWTGAQVGTFSAYRHGGYSWDFEGGSTVINAATEGAGIVAYNNSSDYNVGTNDYSIECWFKHRTPTTYTTNEHFRICEFNDIPNGGSNDRISLQHNNAGNINVKENGTVIVTTTSTPCDGEWHFIQVVRTGGNTKVYIDGTQEASASSSTNIGAISRIVVGAWYEYNYGFDGQIADFRFSNTARTAGTPTKRLTSDSNTKLLVCTKPYLVDESGTATTLSLAKSTNRSNPRITTFTPFDYLEYSESDHGSSIYFDGIEDYLTAGSTANWKFLNDGSTDYTVEAWIYPTSTASRMEIISTNTNTVANGYGVTFMSSLNNDGAIVYQIANGSDGQSFKITTDPNVITANAWNHVAVTLNVSGQELRVYVNGKLVKTETRRFQGGLYYATTFNYGNANPNFILNVGRWVGTVSGAGGYLNGNIQDLRITKSRVYTTDFTPPTAPLSAIANTEFFLNGTGASIIDKSQNANLQSLGNATGSTTQTKFANTKSMYFDGNGDAINAAGVEIPSSATESWTLEAWVYATTSDASVERQVFSQYDGDTFGQRFLFGHNGGNYRLFNGGSAVFSGSGVIKFNTWQHLAATYDGSSGTYTLWVDGNSQGSMVLNRGANNSDLQIGGRVSANVVYNPWIGYIQDARLTTGLVRYTSNFTPPTEPLEG